MHRNFCQSRSHENKLQRNMQQTFDRSFEEKMLTNKIFGWPCVVLIFIILVYIFGIFICMILLLFLFHLLALALIYRCFAERLHIIFTFRLNVIAAVYVNEYLTLT